MIQPLSLAFVLFFLVNLEANEFRVAAGDLKAFEAVSEKLKPGDTLVLQNGTWKDSHLKIKAKGKRENPITFRAETPGKVILKGDSRIALAGQHLLVDGLWFQNPTGTESIEFRRGSRDLAHHCRFTNCAVTSDAKAGSSKKSSRFVSVYGSNNRIDHCYFAGKTTEGPTLVVWLAADENVAHHIDHNHFGPRQRLGRNGGETIRIGDSKTSMLSAACIVEQNLFEKCDGEAECISNKSCKNIYRRNHFIAVSGTLTLRHGNNCRVEENTFLGNEAKGSGGVRVIGEGHLVTGNRFENLTGDDERSALCFMLGVPDSPANAYFQVKRATITNNTFLNCEHNILIGMKGDSKATLPPIETRITGNRIQTNKGKAFEILCETKGIAMEENATGKEQPRDIPDRFPLDSTGPSWRK